MNRLYCLSVGGSCLAKVVYSTVAACAAFTFG